jgi:hypothetical protein
MVLPPLLGLRAWVRCLHCDRCTPIVAPNPGIGVRMRRKACVLAANVLALAACTCERAWTRLARRAAVVGLCALCLWFASINGARAAADPADKATAEVLFQEGKALMRDGKFDVACAKLAESQRLDPAVGTLLFLGECYENNGQTASAWATFVSAASAASHAGQARRAEVAKKRAEALEPKLSRLVIRVPAASNAGGLTIIRDGKDIARPVWGTAIPIDPGPHEVKASAPGKKPWTTKVDVESGGVTTTLDIPTLLDDKPIEPSPLASGSPSALPPPGPVRGPATTPSTGNAQRAIGLVLGGLGVAGIVTGTVFALRSSSQKDEAKTHCLPSDPGQCYPEGVDLNDKAKSSATTANISFLVGGLALASGVIVFLAAPRSKHQDAPPTVSLSAAMGPGSGGVTLQGAW